MAAVGGARPGFDNKENGHQSGPPSRKRYRDDEDAMDFIEVGRPAS